MKIEQIIETYGGQAKFAAKFGLTARTAWNWAHGKCNLKPEQLALYQLMCEYELGELPLVSFPRQEWPPTVNSCLGDILKHNDRARNRTSGKGGE